MLDATKRCKVRGPRAVGLMIDASIARHVDRQGVAGWRSRLRLASGGVRHGGSHQWRRGSRRSPSSRIATAAAWGLGRLLPPPPARRCVDPRPDPPVGAVHDVVLRVRVRHANGTVRVLECTRMHTGRREATNLSSSPLSSFRDLEQETELAKIFSPTGTIVQAASCTLDPRSWTRTPGQTSRAIGIRCLWWVM